MIAQPQLVLGSNQPAKRQNSDPKREPRHVTFPVSLIFATRVIPGGHSGPSL